MGETNGKFTSYLQMAMTVGIFLMGFIMYGFRGDLLEIKNQMFLHLTNAELHVPRATIVSKDEFVIYQAMRDKQMNDVKDGLARIEVMLQKHSEKK